MEPLQALGNGTVVHSLRNTEMLFLNSFIKEGAFFAIEVLLSSDKGQQNPVSGFIQGSADLSRKPVTKEIVKWNFPDGDPNEGTEEERWQMIGRYITSRGSVVAADELAPYLDVPSSKNATRDESYILPVLLRFDGQPELDEEGNILYRFPSLQRTASGSSRRKEYVAKNMIWGT